MPKRIAVVDYSKCHPDKCDHGVCASAMQCEYGNLVQENLDEAPEVNPSKWCRGCTKCVQACPFKAIRMM
jgi:ATP-binding cassette subfamily E protein 1